MKKLKYLLFILPFLFVSNVFALDYDVSNQITSPVAPSNAGTYTGEELNGATNSWNINTRYQGTLQRIRLNIPLPSGWLDGTCFAINNTYTITMNMATSDWRNRFGTVRVVPYSSYSGNWSNGKVNFISMKKITFSFTIPDTYTTCVDYVYIDLPSSGIFTPFTGETNWNLSSVILTDPTYTSGGGSSGGTSGNQDIINNNTQNTENIINNQNDNTSDIIENNNQNTQDIINNQNDNSNKIVESNESLLGQCDRNIFTDSKIIGFGNLRLSNGKYVQIDADTSSNPNLKLAYMYNETFVSENSYLPSISVNRFKWTFTKSSNFNQLRFGVNGTSVDSVLLYDVSNLTNGQEYSLIYNIDNVTQGHISISNIMIIKGNANPTSYIPQGQSQCVSKLDDLKNQQNQNTQDIIDNQNSNTQQQIESQNVCNFYDKNAIKTTNGYLRTNGTINNANGWGISDYISFKKNSSKLEVLEPHTSIDNASFCQYDINKNLISCSQLYTFTNDYIFNDKVNYIRVSILSSINKPQFRICTNGNQALTDSITDSNVENGVGTGFFDDFTSEDFGLSQIITIPLNTIESLTSNTCVPLQLPIPFTNSNITLPCMTEIYETKLPTIYNLWKIVSFGIIAYFIAIDIFYIVKGFKDPESDKVEVLDL